MNQKFLVVFITVILFCASLTTAYAQQSVGGTPISWQNEKLDWRVPDFTLHSFDVQAMLEQDEINNTSKDVPYRFGKNFDVNLNLGNSGRWLDLPSGDRVWLLGIESENAKSINLAFGNYHLQPGCKLFIYSEDHAHLLGAFTSENNSDDALFATYPIPGQRIILELFEPASTAGNNDLSISTITHAYRDLDKVARDIGDSGSCNNNVVCAVGDDWDIEKRAVAMIVVGSNGICTGALVNNTANDGHPYFLTADHCTGGGVSNWVFRFNWQSTTCAGNNVGTFQTVNGSTMLAQGGSADYALLEINNGNTIPNTTNAYFAGWDATGVNPSSQVGIHHPRGDLKKISFDTDAAGTGTFGGATCWRVFDWEDGTTEPGSSGSPLFDQNHRIIGQLYGGEAECSNNVNDYYGKFDVTYPNVCQWLAPGCNTQVIDGYDPFAPTNALDAQITSVTSPVGSNCTASVSPEFVLRNAGTTTLTSATINYNFDGGANQTFSWTGSIASNESASVSLPAQTLSNGGHTFNVTVASPNGGADENNANNSGSSSFTTSSNSVTWFLAFLTDNYPAENNWEIIDTDNGNAVVAASGPYAGTQTTYNESGCLPAGCYQLNVYDSFGDGMQYQGVEGDYTLTDEFGNTLATIVAGANFGAEANHPFCLSAPNINGCTNGAACNYDPAATADDGSCILPDGCTNNTACNFDPNALCDDGSCEFLSCAGCTNNGACNFDPTATIDDNSCEFLSCAGCTDNGACNFDPTATIDDNSCEFLSCAGCTTNGACNFDPSAAIDDGSCEFLSCAGCTDINACNFDNTATIDDGSCIAQTIYYADTDSDGFGDLNNTETACSQPLGYVINSADCDDNNDAVYPNAPGTQEGIDNNCNGQIDPSEQIACTGDLNNDGNRNVSDLLMILQDFGCEGQACEADLDQSGETGSSDILVFLGFFGVSCE